MNYNKLNSVLKEFNEITGISIDTDTIPADYLETAIHQLQCICNAYKEKYDKTYFLQSIIKNQLSAADICRQASTFHISIDSPLALYLIETKRTLDDTVLTVLKYLYADQIGTYLVPISDTRIILLHPYKDTLPYQEQISEITHTLVDTLNTEALVSVKVACGPPSEQLTELHESYEQALTTLNIGKRFHAEQSIFYYDQLGIDRLVYHLPDSACQDFLNEVWKNNIPVSLDPELSSMINCFLHNNLNIAETARQMHMHRNTLIYRIEKIEQQTSLDIRQFEDAMTLKLALMLMNHTSTTERNTNNHE